MGRAKVLTQMDSMPDWYLVVDDLDNSYPVQSAVAGFEFKPDEHYRLFVPDGKYNPCDFRLLPYKTSKRWSSANELVKSKPATASALFLYKEKMADHQKQDRKKVINKIGGDVAYFSDASCASLPAEHSYSKGDCVAVIHDMKDRDNCLLPQNGDPWVAGYGCGQKPKTGCASMLEGWNSYNPSTANIENGGGFPNPDDNHSGEFTFIKVKGDELEYKVWDGNHFKINRWDVKLSDVYVKEGMPFGIPVDVSIYGGSLRIETFSLEEQYTTWKDDYASKKFPRPLYFQKSDSPIIISPPVIVSSELNLPLQCSGKNLNMLVNLQTEDAYNHYTDVDGNNTGLQLPACMILTFSKSPFPDFLDGTSINSNWYTSNPDIPKYSSVYEVNLDMPFRLIYVAPGNRDYSSLRTELNSAVNGNYGLLRTEPRRDANGRFLNFASGLLTDMSFNVPMSGCENGFDDIGNLSMRCFDFNGLDVTPERSASGEHGVFPGYFEINSDLNVIRNVMDDFSSAFPFVFNDLLNPKQIRPKLKSVTYYAQGKIYDIDGTAEGVSFRANPVTLECKNLEYFYL